MRKLLKKTLQVFLRPLASSTPLEKWNYWWGRVFNIKLPGKVKPFAEPTTGCSANINIIMLLLEETQNVKGDIAECGVFQGATLIPVTYFMNKKGIGKAIYGFDSFEGFGDSVAEDRKTGDKKHIDLETEMFQNTSVQLIKSKLTLTKTPTQKLKLVKGYFEKSLPEHASITFSFVHLDCDLASSYLTCLDFFYSRMNSGGVILFDEYEDPVYKSATDTIDNFFEGKAEKPERIERDNYVKYFVRKK